MTFEGWPWFLAFAIPWLVGVGVIVNWIGHLA